MEKPSIVWLINESVYRALRSKTVQNKRAVKSNTNVFIINDLITNSAGQGVRVGRAFKQGPLLVDLSHRIIYFWLKTKFKPILHKIWPIFDRFVGKDP